MKKKAKPTPLTKAASAKLTGCGSKLTEMRVLAAELAKCDRLKLACTHDSKLVNTCKKSFKVW